MENNLSAILEGLNSEQKKAVECTEGPVLIIAGAGSGKTRVITDRIAYILSGGVEPDNILALTFTKKAATEMKNRIAALVGERKARRLYMGTFHSIFVRFLREFADRIGYPSSFTIYDQSDAQSAVKACIRQLGLKDDEEYKPKRILSRISWAKNNLVTFSSYLNKPEIQDDDRRAKIPQTGNIYKAYTEYCRKQGVMDFDDILMNMAWLLTSDKQALMSISDRFKYIMVDEFQDTNLAQSYILDKMSLFHKNICVVGDDSQSIYAFRGARIENILNFSKKYPDRKLFRLEQNYRSTKTIVNAANSVISRNESRIPKTCFAVGDQGEKIEILKCYTEQEEALRIASAIVDRMQSDHAQYQDFAILYRTNAQSRALEEQLRKRNLPYVIYSGNSFFERAEVKDMMAYLKLSVNPNDDESFKRVVNTPARGIGDTSLKALEVAAQTLKCSLFKASYADDLEEYGLKPAASARIRSFSDMIRKAYDASGNTDAQTLAGQLSSESGLYLFYKSDNTVESQSKAENIQELLNSVASFKEERFSDYREQMIEDGAIQEDTPLEEKDLPPVLMGEFLEDISLLSSVDVDDDKTNNRIALMTVHSAKGP